MAILLVLLIPQVIAVNLCTAAEISFSYELEPIGAGLFAFGFGVLEIRDINNDDISELSVGWPRASSSGSFRSGRVVAVDGVTGDSLFTITSPEYEGGGLLGWSVDNLNDINGDDVDELVVGAIGEGIDPNNMYLGRVYVFDGKEHEMIHALSSPNSEHWGQFGWSVAGLTDVNNDSIADFAVATPWEDPYDTPDKAGIVYIYSGDSGELIYELHSQNEEAYGYFGHDIIGLEDVDGDGCGDMAVGAYGEDGPDGLLDAGRVYIVNAGTGGTIRILYSPNAEYSGHFGKAIAQVEDLDHDGIRDVLVGAPWEDPGDSRGMAGRAYVFSAGTGTCIHSFKSYNEEWNGFFGMAVAGTRDIDGDGYGEIAVGAPWEDKSEEEWNAGRVYVFSGGSGELLQVLESPNMQKEGYYGSSITGFGLTGNAGPLALAVGAPGEFDEHGRVYVYSAPVGIDEPPLALGDYALRIAEMPVTDDGTELKFVLPENGLVNLSIYDLNGRVLDRLVNASLERGVHTVRWHPGRGEGIRIASGTYVCTLRCKGGVISRRIVVLR